MKKIMLIICLPLMFIIDGCYMHTITGSNHYFTSETNAEKAKYHLWIEYHGAKRKAFNDKTKKKIYVGIKKQEQLILFREYELTAASIVADVSWEKLDKLKITFFDFDAGVSIYRNHAYKSGKILFILNFTFEPDRGVFTESPIGEELKRKIRKN